MSLERDQKTNAMTIFMHTRILIELITSTKISYCKIIDVEIILNFLKRNKSNFIAIIKI